MKTFLASTALALLVAGPAAAASHMSGDMFVNTSAAGDIYGSNLIGMRLYVAETAIDETAPVTAEARTDWNDVGEINDVLISTEGEVKAVLLDIGGFLGMGEKTIAVDLNNLKFLHDNNDPNDVFVAMQGTQDMLESAPEFKRSDMTEQTPVDTVATNTTATDTTASGDPMQAWQRPAIERNGYQTLAAIDLTAEDLTGANVYGADDGSIGEIEDLVLSDDGQIQQAIIDVGGFLGMGEHRIAVSFDEVQIVRSNDGSDLRVYVAASQQQLEARPAYEG
ncbi:MAG: PRC-barrel domain-containing protein [Paracoccaceae bacterium]